MQKKIKTLGIRLTPELHKIVKQTALDDDISIQDYIVGLITADAQARQEKEKSDSMQILRAKRG